jgi:hypothetical protein
LASGLPNGLTVDSATGTLSGKPLAAGAFPVTMRVTDSARSTAVNLYTLNVLLPPVPGISLSGVPAQAKSADQIPVQIKIDAPYTGTISGQLMLTFVPTQGGDDPTIQFATGGRTANFTIDAGNTTAPAIALQTGTVSGTIQVTLQAQAFGKDVTPQPQPTPKITLPAAAPVITAVQSATSGQTVSVQVTGFSSTREISQAAFNFGASQGSTLQSGQFTVAVDKAFASWYQDPNASKFGSQFIYTQTFTVQGDAAAVRLQSVTLTNTVGSTNFTATQ